MKRILYLLLLLTYRSACMAQIGMGGPAHPSAVLALKSPTNNQGFLLPRLTTVQRKAITNPAAGLLVFDLTENRLYLFDGQNWLKMVTTTTNALLSINRMASDAAQTDLFGYSAAISGDYAVIGAWGRTGFRGAAYVFVRSGSTWQQQATLTASDGVANDQFGTTVAISGDYIVVGAVAANAFRGAAYVFTRSGSTWTQQAKLTAGDGEAQDRFGVSVALSGDYAVIGSFYDQITDAAGTYQCGSAYVFIRTGSAWAQQAKLVASDRANSDFFGGSVALSGNTALIGAYGCDVGGNSDRGAAYVFVRSGTTWTEQTKLVALDGSVNDAFGYTVALSDEYALVGAPNDQIGGNTGQGSAYVFTRSGTFWQQQAKLTADNGASGDNFGKSLALSGNYAVVGANYSDPNGVSDQGSAYLFARSGSIWTQTRQLTDYSTPSTLNGTSVALSNGTFLIGGPYFNANTGKIAFGTVD